MLFIKSLDHVITTTVHPDGTYGVSAAPAALITNPVPSLLVFVLILCMMICAPLSYVRDGQQAYTQNPQAMMFQASPAAKKEAAKNAAPPPEDAMKIMNLFPKTESSSSGIRLLPQSSSRFLTSEEILAASQNSSYSTSRFLKLAALEILAVNGDTLEDKGSAIRQYFNDLEWYSSIPDKHIVTPDELNDFERANIALLSNMIGF